MNASIINTYRGEHRGIGYEVTRWGRGEGAADKMVAPVNGTWNYYLIIPLKQIPAEIRERFVARDNMVQLSPEGEVYKVYRHEETVFADVDFHCGVTYYDISHDTIKVGCDYDHYWDEGRTQYFERVNEDAINTIDDLLSRYNLYIRCEYCGKYDGEPRGEHNWHLTCWEKHKEWCSSTEASHEH